MDLVHPLLRWMVRRVRGAGNVVAEERFVRLNLVDSIEVLDGFVGHAGDEVPTRLAFKRIDLCGVAEQVRLPLVRIAADKPVEVLKSLPDGPIVERSDLTGAKCRHIVVFAEPGSGVAVVQ